MQDAEGKYQSSWHDTMILFVMRWPIYSFELDRIYGWVHKLPGPVAVEPEGH